MGKWTVSTKDRDIFFSGEINEESMSDLYISIYDLIKDDDEKEEGIKGFTREPIYLRINSYGGSVYDCFSVIDLIESSKTPVYTYAVGKCMSMAVCLLLSGKNRYASKNTTFMIHDISLVGLNGTIKSIDYVMDHNKTMRDAIKKIIIESTVIKEKEFDEIIKQNKDYYFGSEKALKLGIIDEIV